MGSSGGGTRIGHWRRYRGAGPKLSFSLNPDEVPATAIALMREDDEIGLCQLLDDRRRRGRAYIENDELTEDQLPGTPSGIGP